MTQEKALEMVAGVERLVLSMARRYARIAKGGLDVEDLLQVGRYAVWAATETYDENKGASFVTYAYSALRIALGNMTRRGVLLVSLNGPAHVNPQEASLLDDEECLIDGLPSDEVLADVRLEAAQRERTVQNILARVKAEHFAKKPELFDAVVERLMGSFEAKHPSGTAAVNHCSEVTLEDIALRCQCSREWARRTEVSVRAHLVSALAEAL